MKAASCASDRIVARDSRIVVARSYGEAPRWQRRRLAFGRGGHRRSHSPSLRRHDEAKDGAREMLRRRSRQGTDIEEMDIDSNVEAVVLAAKKYRNPEVETEGVVFRVVTTESKLIVDWRKKT